MAVAPASNPLFHALACGFLVQLSKVLTFLLREKRINVRRLVETGGMPSSHAASVAALSTCVGLLEGFDSVLFNVVVFFSLIVMYDAAGLRRAARQPRRARSASRGRSRRRSGSCARRAGSPPDWGAGPRSSNR